MATLPLLVADPVDFPSWAGSLANETGPLVLVSAVAIVALVGTIVVVRSRGSRSGDGTPPGDGASPGAGTEPSDSPTADGRGAAAPDTSDRAGDQSSPAGFDERVGRKTLDRLEPVAGDPVERARTHLRSGTDRPDPDRVERIQRELRDGVQDALADGRFHPAVSSRYGEFYELVNLPERLREVRLPSFDDPVHVDDLGRSIRAELEDGAPLRELARTVSAVLGHIEEMDAYVDRREESFATTREEVEGVLADVGELVDRLDGELADRVSELVVDGRRKDGPGVVDLERRIEVATGRLHECRFDDAKRELRSVERDAEALLMTVDFLGALAATLAHEPTSTTVGIPEPVDMDLLSQLEPLLERQYGVDLDRDGTAYHVENRTASASGAVGDACDRSTTNGRERRSRSGNGRRDPRTVADEILYILRELSRDADTSEQNIEYQTEVLPPEVASTEVLDELVAFCERQSDIVSSVQLQDDAPPGFLALTFDERTTAESAIDTLSERFAEKYGS